MFRCPEVLFGAGVALGVETITSTQIFIHLCVCMSGGTITTLCPNYLLTLQQ